ncbi:MAG: hypothetical protein ABIJ57_16705 [Pseudomonadota bacterium]
MGNVHCDGISEAGGICPDGKIPTLAKGNYEAWGLFQVMLPGLVREDGFDYAAIQVVFDAHAIDQDRRPTMLNQTIKLIGVVDAERMARRQSK